MTSASTAPSRSSALPVISLGTAAFSLALQWRHLNGDIPVHLEAVFIALVVLAVAWLGSTLSAVAKNGRRMAWLFLAAPIFLLEPIMFASHGPVGFLCMTKHLCP